MSNRIAKKYCRRVGRRLECLPETKRALLRGLMDEIADLPEEDRVSILGIEAKLGRIPDVAAELQCSVASKDYFAAVYCRRQRERLVAGIALVLGIVMCIGAVVYAKIMWEHAPLYVIETIEELS